MAKGDEKRARSRIDEQRALGTDTLDRLDTRLTDRYHEDVPRYQNAANQAGADYSEIMGRYRSLADDPSNFRTVDYNRSPELSSAFAGYQRFADTGGFSPEDIANMRARGVSPIRSMYANARNEIDRQRALQGGYSPNRTAALASMARSQNQQMTDAVQDVEARLAEMRQQGQLAGLQGLGGLSIQDLQLAQNAALNNAQIGRDKANIVHGMANMFGTTPGMANMFRDQVNQTTGDMANAAQLRTGFGSNLINSQINASQIPGQWENTMGRVGQIGSIVGNLASIPFGGGASNFMNPGLYGAPSLSGSGNMSPGVLQGRQIRF